MKSSGIPVDMRVALYYLLFGITWIVLSDQAAVVLFREITLLTMVQTYKGWFFVAMSSLLIYLLVRREIAAEFAAAETLRESEERYRQLFDNSIDAILLTAPDGSIYSANPAACAMFGRTEQEIIRVGRSGLADTSDPRLATALEERARNGYFYGELTFYRADGTTFPGEISTRVFKTGHGEERTTMIIRDISKRREMEAELENVNALLYTAFQQSQAGIAIADGSGKITYINDSGLRIGSKDFSRLAVSLGQYVASWQLYHLDGRKMKEDEVPLARAILYDEANSLEFVVRREDKDVIVLTNAAPIYDHNHNKTGGVAVFLDITSQKQAEREVLKLNADLEQRVTERTAQLEFANREMEAFTYSISHDLRAPLRAINGFASILLNRHSQALHQEGLRYLENIIQASRRMADLIDDLLTYSRLGRSGFQREPVALGDLLPEIIGQFQAELDSLGASVTLPENLPTVLADASLLGRVFTNLLENAIKYRKPGQPLQIEITTARKKGRVQVFVKDNGIGISPEYHQKIFNIFQRLHADEEYPGTGIGLAAVKKVLDLMGGEISVDSTIDKGSTFCINLYQG